MLAARKLSSFLAFVACVALVASPDAQTAQPAAAATAKESPKEFKALKYRNIGPAAGGRVARATGVPGDPPTD
jgi:hypothetical protein